MARGLGDVLEAWVDAPPPPALPLRLVIAIEPGARVAAGVAAALVSALARRGLPGRLSAADPGAAALLGPVPLASAGRRLAAWLATSPPRAPCDGTLEIAPPLAPVRWLAAAPRLAPEARIALGDPRTAPGAREIGGPPHAWLASLTEGEALRAALGAPTPAVERAADAVARWLSHS